MVSRFLDAATGDSFVYEHQPEYEAAYVGRSERVDVWNPDDYGRPMTWVGAFIKTKRGIHRIGNVPLIMHEFVNSLLGEGK